MKNFYKFLIYCFGYYYSRLIKGDKLPENINFPINNVCNAKCVMCDVWKENDYDELSIEDLNHLSESGFLKNLKHVGLSGGEPFLRKDIDKIVNSLINNPKIKSLSITSHGFNTERIKQKIPIIVDSCKKSNVKFRINFSLDGINELHDQIRGVKGGFTKLVNSINFCQKIGCEIELQCTVTKRNVYNLIEIQHWARENECNIIYRLGTSIERLDNLKTMKMKC